MNTEVTKEPQPHKFKNADLDGFWNHCELEYYSQHLRGLDSFIYGSWVCIRHTIWKTDGRLVDEYNRRIEPTAEWFRSNLEYRTTYTDEDFKNAIEQLLKLGLFKLDEDGVLYDPELVWQTKNWQDGVYPSDWDCEEYNCEKGSRNGKFG